MTGFDESLTIRILADSQPLQRELSAVIDRLNRFAQQADRLADVAGSLDGIASAAARLHRPFDRLNSRIASVTRSLRHLSGTPVTLNVQPALGALASLGSMADFVAAKLARLGTRPALPVPQPAGPIRRFHRGGLVQGPSGIDQVPALLSAGEFVLQNSAVRQLGTTFLNALNTPGGGTPSRAMSSGSSRAPVPPPATPATVNNFGGLSIQLNRPAELNHLIRDLRIHGIRSALRRG